MVKMSGVSKRLGNFTIDNVSFEIPKGYICAIAGRNGAGKTTIFNLLTGLYKPEKGEILFDGNSLTENEKEIHDLTGCVFREELFENDSSLKRNALIYGRYFKNFDCETFEKYLEKFDLLLDKKYGKLSKGQKLKFEFAFALSHNPKVLLLDEPSANFDPEFRNTFFEILKDFIKDGDKSVLFSSQQTDDLDRIADYLLFFDRGQLVYGGNIEAFRDKYKIITAEKYKIKNLLQDKIISCEFGKYSSKALVYDSKIFHEDLSLSLTVPSIEEFMYFYGKDIEPKGDR